MSGGSNELLCISRGKDVLLFYVHAFKGTPSNTPAHPHQLRRGHGPAPRHLRR